MLSVPSGGWVVAWVGEFAQLRLKISPPDRIASKLTGPPMALEAMQAHAAQPGPKGSDSAGMGEVLQFLENDRHHFLGEILGTLMRDAVSEEPPQEERPIETVQPGPGVPGIQGSSEEQAVAGGFQGILSAF